MKVDFRWPLSGGVMQAINPMSFMTSLITINPGRTSNPDLEQRIVNEVASYGRQIGRMSDALEVLINRIEDPAPRALSQDEKDALYCFRLTLKEIRRFRDLHQ
jgi:hypothetical protein